MKPDTWNYQTKCRICGVLTEWYFSDGKSTKWADFANAIQDHIRDPRQYKCDMCDKETVQDVVSYDTSGKTKGLKLSFE